MMLPAAMAESRDSGLVAHVINRELGLVALDADSAYDHVFHAHRFFLGNGADVFVQTRSHLEFDSEFLGELDRARLHDLCAGTGHLEQFIIGNFVELVGVGDDARITSEDAIDIGKDLAGVRVERTGQSDRGQIGAPAAQRRRFAFRRLSLKPRDDDDVIVRQEFVNLPAADVRDLGLGVDAVGQDTRLRAGN